MRRNKTSSPKERTIKKIMVTGVEEGVGATHFSILLASYYVFIRGKKVCIVDLSETKDYLYMDQLYNGADLMEKSYYSYRIKKIDFMVRIDLLSREEIISKALERDYDIVIFDNGINLDVINRDMIMCDVKYIVGSCSLWKAAEFEKQICRIKQNGMCRYVYIFGDRVNAEIIGKKNNVKLYHVPFTCSPFRIDKKQLSAIERIIWEEEWR